MMEVTIHKHRLTGNFTQISNAIIEDTRLSCEAFRLLSWLLHSYPDTKHCFDEWQEVIGAGIRKLKKVLSELEELGYLKQVQKRNEYGQFMRTEYQFFDSSSQEDFTVCPKPSDSSCKDTYYNNTSSNMSVSVLSYPETEQNGIVETVENSVESNEELTDCITSSFNEIIAENEELKEKLSLVPDRVEFMQNLTDTIRTALLRLKHPEAKGKFIKNTIIHILEKIKAKKSVPTPKPEKKSIPVVDEEKAEKRAFTSWLKEKLCVEEHLQESDTEYCHFLSSVIDSLSELVFTGRAGKRVVDGYEIREKLCLIDRIDGNLDEFADDFWYRFRQLLSEKEIRNKNRYMTAVLPDFIRGYGTENIKPTRTKSEEMKGRYLKLMDKYGNSGQKKYSLTPEQVERCDSYLSLVNQFDDIPPTYRCILIGLSDEKQKHYLSRIPKEYFDKEIPSDKPLTEKTLEEFVTMAEYLIVQEQITGNPMIW